MMRQQFDYKKINDEIIALGFNNKLGDKFDEELNEAFLAYKEEQEENFELFDDSFFDIL